MRPVSGLLLAALLSVGATRAGDQRAGADSLGQNRLSIAGRPGRLDLRRFCDCDDIRKTEFWFDSEGTDVRYLVLTVSSDSNPTSPSGRCGAGEETVLVWLKLGPRLRVLDSQTFLIASCWQTVQTSASPANAAAPLEWRFDTVSNDGVARDYVVTFDRQGPQRGFHAHYAFSPW